MPIDAATYGARRARAAAAARAARIGALLVSPGSDLAYLSGHGIGLDGHEEPYLVTGNTEALAPGMAFSIEPGIYLPGRFGVRIEDIASISVGGTAEPLNRADRSLAIVS